MPQPTTDQAPVSQEQLAEAARKKSALYVICGFVAACVVPAMFFAVLAPIGGSRSTSSLAFSFALLCFFEALAIVFLALPTYFVLHRFQLVRWWSVLVSGAVIGAVVSVVLFASSVETTAKLSLQGFLAALVFWLVLEAGGVTMRGQRKP